MGQNADVLLCFYRDSNFLSQSSSRRSQYLKTLYEMYLTIDITHRDFLSYIRIADHNLRTPELYLQGPCLAGSGIFVCC